ncbi:adenylyl-sulfate kinase [Varunaivibrio sulfuroxidans]|uniref:adenylyl-sulfate kinase n=1 Tax=Varunaivibrio sulfuroxidans TaxID=1773489 RepID=UPI001FB46618|nr:adenylyl-sulfate kinase [Varunaivibrio sulfuroxidans]WES29961.1 adenylyl-sulfate kinase [Varunaivibrio sulfuroxidans]
MKSTNIFEVEHKVTREQRWARNGHKAAVVWFTGLSASGKSTLAIRLEQRLFDLGHQVYVLDGDNMRRKLCADLGFSAHDREENIRRIGEVAALFAESGQIVISAFISPYRADRALARRAVGDNFHEIYLSADVEICARRDPKGLYAKARKGEIDNLTGVSAPYEVPKTPDLTIDTGTLSVDESLDILVDYVMRNMALSGD